MPTVSETAGLNPAWHYGLVLLEAGFYWEAHEVLEPVWMNAAEDSAERHLVQAVIQLANGALKIAMGRPKAAERLFDMVRDLLAKAGPGPVMGLDPLQVVQTIATIDPSGRITTIAACASDPFFTLRSKTSANASSAIFWIAGSKVVSISTSAPSTTATAPSLTMV